MKIKSRPSKGSDKVMKALSLIRTRPTTAEWRHDIVITMYALYNVGFIKDFSVGLVKSTGPHLAAIRIIYKLPDADEYEIEYFTRSVQE